MNPPADAALRSLMATLMAEVAPKMGDDYAKASVNIIAVVQMLVAEEFDRAAAVRFWENAEMRKLLAQAARVLNDVDGSTSLPPAADNDAVDLRISILNRTNAALKEQLIAVQTRLEARSDSAAAALRRTLWQFLVEAAQRRAFSF